MLDQTSAELASLKNAYKERNDESTVLKEKVQNLDNNNIKLLSEIETLKANESQQTEKLGLLNQSTAELTTLKEKLKELGSQNVTLKSKINNFYGYLHETSSKACVTW